MYVEKYLTIESRNYTAFEFFSEGPKGRIKKVVKFTKIKAWGDNIFNLSFGDLTETKKKLNDRIITNNSDREKVLATVAITVLEFTKQYPEVFVYAEGISPSRTRLYQILINKYLHKISRHLDVYGKKNNKWEPFRSDRNYEAFLAKAK